MILVDYPKNGWCHMVGTSAKELHEFAALIGVKRCWFSNATGKHHPHYDLRPNQADKAVRWGAERVTSQRIIEFLNEVIPARKQLKIN